MNKIDDLAAWLVASPVRWNELTAAEAAQSLASAASALNLGRTLLDAAGRADPIADISFDAAWQEMKARGYDYGDDALEQVRLGWMMRLDCEKRKR